MLIFASMFSIDDERFMRRAIALARLGHGHVSPNPAVGCVIVSPSGRIVGEGWHRRYGEGHAEVNAVGATRPEDLPGATVYVTLEPCAHYGKTPPCAELLARLPVARLVAGMVDPNPKVSGRGLEMLREAGKQVESGLLERECRALNPTFLKAQASDLPYVTLKWACDSRGMIGYSDGRRLQVSSPAGQLRVHRLRTLHDAIMVGRRTALADNPSLTPRLWPGASPRPVITGGDGSRPEGLTLSGDRHALWLPRQDDLRRMLRTLRRDHRITSLLVEGGAELLRAFIDAGLFDAIRRERGKAGSDADIAAPEITGASLISTDHCGDSLIELWHRTP